MTIQAFKTSAEHLLIGGSTAAEIVDVCGQSPLFAYDREAISARAEMLRQQLPPSMCLHYAIKANPMPAVVGCLASSVDGLDVASHGELIHALGTGMAPNNISLAGPGKDDIELLAAATAGVIINVESPNELERITGIAKRIGRRVAVALRVNPDFTLKRSGMIMGGGAQQFGIDAETITSIIDRMDHDAIELAGFQLYCGSQNLHAHSLIEAQNSSVELLIRLAQHASRPLSVLNLGGGFGIPYFADEQALDLEPVMANLRARFDDIHESIDCQRIVLELGRYLVGEAGYYITRVLDRKVSRGKTFLVVDGGLHHHLAASGNFGQVIRRNFPVVAANRMNQQPTEKVSVVGRLCTPLDILADNISLPHLEPGDLIAILQSGAYACTASPVNFLSFAPAMEILVGQRS